MVKSGFIAERRMASFADGALQSIILRSLGTITRLSLRGDEQACRAASAFLGLALPDILRASSKDGRALLWQGPDEFLIHAHEDERITLFAGLETCLQGHAHSLVDVSHRDVGFTLEGVEVEALLSSVIMLDLHERSFPIGMTTRTLLGKAEITLWRQGPHLFLIETGRSYVSYCWGLLEEGARGL